MVGEEEREEKEKTQTYKEERKNRRKEKIRRQKDKDRRRRTTHSVQHTTDNPQPAAKVSVFKETHLNRLSGRCRAGHHDGHCLSRVFVNPTAG